jgi:hypothetical protein
MGLAIKNSVTYIWLLLGLILVGLGTAACGKKMAPIPPDSLLPGPVRDFTINQEGRSLVLRWLIPRVNIEGQPLTELQGFQIFRAQEESNYTLGGCPPELTLLADIDLAFPRVGEVRGEALAYQDIDLAPGYRYYYRVTGYDREGHLGTASSILTHEWGVLPRAPEHLRARAGDRVVKLDWKPVTRLVDGKPVPGSVGYQVYRRAPGQENIRVNVNLLADPYFQDLTVKNDVEYRYVVRAVRQVRKDFLESANSLEQQARPEDITPPAPVLHLVVVPTRQGLELRWEPSPEKDLAGYRLYRRALAELYFHRLHPGLLSKAYFVDSQVKKGEIYFYYVTAVDNSRRGNESPPSEGVEIRY